MIDRAFIRKYLRGELTPAEAAAFARYVAGDAPAELEAVMAEEWARLGAEAPPLDPALSARMWAQVQQQTTASRPRPLYARRLWQVAAAVLLLLGVGLGVWQPWTPAMLTVSTPYGMQEVVTLPDGSVVHLNGNTTLRYAERWPAEATRRVWLEGEAYFEVADRHAEGIKFEVLTPGLAVEVLGTAFNVNTGADETLVYLDEGEIQLRLADEPAHLSVQPGELVAYSPVQGAITSRKRVKGTHHTSWKDGILQFEEAPLAEVLARLEDIYGVHLAQDDPNLTQDRLLTLAVPGHDLDMALSFIGKAMGLEVIRTGDTLRLQAR